MENKCIICNDFGSGFVWFCVVYGLTQNAQDVTLLMLIVSKKYFLLI